MECGYNPNTRPLRWKTVYLSKNGNDDTGELDSKKRPFKTMQGAVDRCKDMKNVNGIYVKSQEDSTQKVSL